MRANNLSKLTPRNESPDSSPTRSVVCLEKLNNLASVAPAWLKTLVTQDLFDCYEVISEQYRYPPKKSTRTKPGAAAQHKCLKQLMRVW